MRLNAPPFSRTPVFLFRASGKGGTSSLLPPPPLPVSIHFFLFPADAEARLNVLSFPLFLNTKVVIVDLSHPGKDSPDRPSRTAFFLRAAMTLLPLRQTRTKMVLPFPSPLLPAPFFSPPVQAAGKERFSDSPPSFFLLPFSFRPRLFFAFVPKEKVKTTTTALFPPPPPFSFY